MEDPGMNLEDLKEGRFSQKVPNTCSHVPVLEDWPTSTDAPGTVVPVMPWEAARPPGQEELKDEL